MEKKNIYIYIALSNDAPGVKVSTPCGELSPQGITASVPGSLELYIYMEGVLIRG